MQQIAQLFLILLMGYAHGIKQSSADLRCILDLKGVQNDTGHDQIDKVHRQHLAVRCLLKHVFSLFSLDDVPPME